MAITGVPGSSFSAFLSSGRLMAMPILGNVAIYGRWNGSGLFPSVNGHAYDGVSGV